MGVRFGCHEGFEKRLWSFVDFEGSYKNIKMSGRPGSLRAWWRRSKLPGKDFHARVRVLIMPSSLSLPLFFFLLFFFAT